MAERVIESLVVELKTGLDDLTKGLQQGVQAVAQTSRKMAAAAKPVPLTVDASALTGGINRAAGELAEFAREDGATVDLAADRNPLTESLATATKQVTDWVDGVKARTKAIKVDVQPQILSGLDLDRELHLTGLIGDQKLLNSLRTEEARLLKAGLFETKEFLGVRREIAGLEKQITDEARKQAAARSAGGRLDAFAKATTEKLAAFREGALALGVAAAALGAALGSATSTFGDFEQALNGVRAVSGATAEEMERVKAAALDLGRTTKFSAREAAAGFFELGKAGFTSAEQIAAMPGVLALAAAAGTDVGEAAEVAGGTLRGFGLAASEATHVADLLAKAANVSAVDVSDLRFSMKQVAAAAKGSGQSLSDMMGILAFLGNRFIKGEQAGTSLRATLLKLQAPAEDAKTTMRQLGLTIADASGHMLPLTAIVGQLRVALASQTEAQKNAALTTLFGIESVTTMLALVNAAPGELDAMTGAMKHVKGEAQAMADIMNRGLNAEMKRLAASVEALSIKIGEDLAPMLQGAAKAAKGLVDAFAGLPDGIRQSVVIIAGVSAALLGIAAAVGAAAMALPALVAGMKAVGILLVPLKIVLPGLTLLWGPFGAALIAVGAAAVFVAGEMLKMRKAIDDAGGANEAWIDASNRLTVAGGPAVAKFRRGIALTKDEARAAVLHLRQLVNEATDSKKREELRALAGEIQEVFDRLKAAPPAPRPELTGGEKVTGLEKARLQAAAGVITKQQLLVQLQAEQVKHTQTWLTGTREGLALLQEIRSVRETIAAAGKTAIKAEKDALTTAKDTLGEKLALAQLSADGLAIDEDKIRVLNRQKAIYQEHLKTIKGLKGAADEEAQTKARIAEIDRALRQETTARAAAHRDLTVAVAALADDELVALEVKRGIVAAHLEQLRQQQGDTLTILRLTRELRDLDKEIADLPRTQALKAATEARSKELGILERSNATLDEQIAAAERYVATLGRIDAPLQDQLAAERDLLALKSRQAEQAERALDATIQTGRELGEILARGAETKPIKVEAARQDLAGLQAERTSLAGQRETIAAEVAREPDAKKRERGEDLLDRIDQRLEGLDRDIAAGGGQVLVDREEQRGAKLGQAGEVAGLLGALPARIKDASTALASFGSGILEWVQGFASIVPNLIGAVAGITATIVLMPAIIAALIPLLPIIAAVAAVLLALVEMWQSNAGGIQDAVDNLLSALAALWDGLMVIVRPFAEMLGPILAGIAELAAGIIGVVGGILQVVAPIIDFILTFTGLKGLFQIVGQILKTFGSVFQVVGDILLSLAEPLTSFLESIGIAYLPLQLLSLALGFLNDALKAIVEWVYSLPFMAGARQQRAAKAVGGAGGKIAEGLGAGRESEGTDFLKEFRSTAGDISTGVRDGVKDVMNSFTSFNPLPVEDVSKGNFFSLGPAQRFFVQREATVNLQITADGNIDRQALAAAIQHPDVRQQLAQAVGLGNQADALVPRFAF